MDLQTTLQVLKIDDPDSPRHFLESHGKLTSPLDSWGPLRSGFSIGGYTIGKLLRSEPHADVYSISREMWVEARVFLIDGVPDKIRRHRLKNVGRLARRTLVEKRIGELLVVVYRTGENGLEPGSSKGKRRQLRERREAEKIAANDSAILAWMSSAAAITEGLAESLSEHMVQTFGQFYGNDQKKAREVVAMATEIVRSAIVAEESGIEKTSQDIQLDPLNGSSRQAKRLAARKAAKKR